MSSADDDMRDKHALPPRPEPEPEPDVRPLNLMPIRAAVQVWQSNHDAGRSGNNNINLAVFAARAIPSLCDEIVRLRAVIADMQVTPA